jgi:hypothetical protein
MKKYALLEAQMMLYALKGDVDPDGPEARAEYRKMRKAVADLDILPALKDEDSYGATR